MLKVIEQNLYRIDLKKAIVNGGLTERTILVSADTISEAEDVINNTLFQSYKIVSIEVDKKVYSFSN